MKILKSLILEFAPLKYIWLKIDWIITKHLINKDVKIIPNNIYKRVFDKNINWDNPTNLIEKIYWMQLYTDTSLWTKCADKYLVREYVKEKVCEDSLNTLYGRWENANEIDWKKLPERFVLKTNNSCGKVILIRDKKTININSLTKTLNSWLKLKYGYRDGQFHYTKIKPCIIAEKLFENKINPNESLVDFKIWCFNGEPESVLIVHNRMKGKYSLSVYDMQWNNISKKALKQNISSYSGVNFPKPDSFDQMIQYAKKLSIGIPQVRVDFYDIDGQAVFGEMTFSTGYGYFTDEYYNYLGNKIDFNKVQRISDVNNPLK